MSEPSPTKGIRVFETLGILFVVLDLIFHYGIELFDVGFAVIYVFLVVSVSRRRKQWARWVLSCLLGIGLIASAVTAGLHYTALIPSSLFDWFIVAAITAMAIAQLAILLSPDMSDWLKVRERRDAPAD